MAKKWYVGYFYKGYLKQLTNAIENHEEFKDVRMWYPYIKKIVAKEGKKIVVKEALFDNYVLFEIEDSSFVWKNIIRKTPILRFLKDEDTGMPIPISEQELIHIMRLTEDEDIKDYSYLINKEVKVVSGAFSGLTGYCKSIIKGRYKAKVFMKMFGIVEREVEINLEDLELFKQE